MENVKITCPLCGYSKEVSADTLPKTAFRINCPKCKQASIHNPPEPPAPPLSADGQAGAPSQEKTPPAAAPSPPSPPPSPSPPGKPRIKAVCPHCGLVKEVPEGAVQLGASVSCPKCRQRFVFPGASPSEQAPAAPSSANDEVEAEAEVPRAVPAPPAMRRAALSDIGELFGRSWEVYKKRVFVLLPLIVLSGIMFAVPFGLLFGLGILLSMVVPAGKGAIMFLCILAGGAAGVAGGMWAAAAFLSAVVDEGLSFKDSFTQGRPLILPLLWLMIVTGFVIFGGYLFFIIPGIVFTLWFLFAQLILADGRGVGMDALLSSRALGKGNWLGVFGRLIVVWLASVVVSVIPILGVILSLLFTPFMLIYICQMYEDLKEMRGDEAFAPHPGERWRLVGVAAMGYLIVPVLIVAFLVSFSVKHNVTIKEALISQSGIGKALEGMGLISLPPSGEEKKPGEMVSGVPSGGTAGGTTGGDFAGQITQAITDSLGSSVKTDKMTYAPGEAVKVTFTAPASFPDNAWIGIIPNDIPHGDEAVNDQHDIEYQYIQRKTSGEMTFTAPAQPGRYDMRMHDTDNNGKETAYTWFEVAVGGASQPSQGQTSQVSPTSPAYNPGDARRLSVYVYALNYKGEVRLNGETFYVIKGEKDMNYNYSSYENFKEGRNVFEVDYTALPDSWKSEVEIKVSDNSGNVINDWKVEDPGGRKTFEVNVP